jgi:hypothetical protein
MSSTESDLPESSSLIVILDSVHGHIEELVSLSKTVPRSVVFGIDVLSLAWPLTRRARLTDGLAVRFNSSV